MALALGQPGLVRDVVAVDNAPVDAVLSTDFAKYVRGMKKVEDANVSSQKEADRIFAEFEEVGIPPPLSCAVYFVLLSLRPPPLGPSGRRSLGCFPSNRVPSPPPFIQHLPPHPPPQEANKKTCKHSGTQKATAATTRTYLPC